MRIAPLFNMWKFACLVGLVTPVLANTEKAIFLGPKTVNIPPTHPNLGDLYIDTLTPQNWTVRTHVQAQFPTDTAEFGTSTWLVLDQLSEGQRYELRVCWAATQPTAFRINTYSLETVFGTPELISDLYKYSLLQQTTEEGASPDEYAEGVMRQDREASILLLQILAAAEYFTTNQSLMDNVPPVFVDIILDPYIFNVLPRSLVPTVGYIIVVAIASWFLAKQISLQIRGVATTAEKLKKDQ